MQKSATIFCLRVTTPPPPPIPFRAFFKWKKLQHMFWIRNDRNDPSNFEETGFPYTINICVSFMSFRCKNISKTVLSSHPGCKKYNSAYHHYACYRLSEGLSKVSIGWMVHSFNLSQMKRWYYIIKSNTAIKFKLDSI